MNFWDLLIPLKDLPGSQKMTSRFLENDLSDNDFLFLENDFPVPGTSRFLETNFLASGKLTWDGGFKEHLWALVGTL